MPDGVSVVAADAAVVYGCAGLDSWDWLWRWPPTMADMLAGAEAAWRRSRCASVISKVPAS